MFPAKPGSSAVKAEVPGTDDPTECVIKLTDVPVEMTSTQLLQMLRTGGRSVKGGLAGIQRFYNNKARPSNTAFIVVDSSEIKKYTEGSLHPSAPAGKLVKGSKSSRSEMNLYFIRSQRNIEMAGEEVTVAVQGFSEICDQDDIREFFAGMGVTSIYIPRRNDNNSIGLAFVTFSTMKAVAEVIGWSGQELMGSQVEMSVWPASAVHDFTYYFSTGKTQRCRDVTILKALSPTYLSSQGWKHLSQ